MKRLYWPAIVAALLLPVLPSGNARAQVDEDQLGLWNMYFYNTTFGESRWGLQGDFQYRLWDTSPGGDLEQLLLRSGVTYRPKSMDNVLLTLGYANITSGQFGDGTGPRSSEDRIYQEALISQKLGERVYLRHRFRYEQRWVDDQDFRTRWRYALFADIPLNGTDLERGAWYVSLYNEIFINGERDIGDGREVEYFDRNRTYGALGYAIRDNLRTQFGYMWQQTDDIGKGQLQLSLHHAF
jgi:hypothetical protein